MKPQQVACECTECESKYVVTTLEQTFEPAIRGGFCPFCGLRSKVVEPKDLREVERAVAGFREV